MKINELNAPVQPDTYEASMFIKQAIRAGKYAIKIHDLLSNDQEMESWVAKKIDLATGYISTIGHYMEGQGISEDAGEGHMSKSQLYAAAKYCLTIASSVRPGDDIEGWVQTKMNRAVDMLDAVYHYEDYQKLNPYRETLGDVCDQHSAIIQKKIDEILAYETEIDDIETKPGMFNILKKRVNEFEKKMSREMDEGSKMPSSMIQHKQKLDAMSPEEINDFFQKRAHFFGKPAKELARNQELRFGKQVAAMAPYSRHIQEYNVNTPFKRKILNKLRGPVDLVKQRQDKEAYQDKMQTLQNISKDPSTSYDQQLKDKLSARLDKLRTSGL